MNKLKLKLPFCMLAAALTCGCLSSCNKDDNEARISVEGATYDEETGTFSGKAVYHQRSDELTLKAGQEQDPQLKELAEKAAHIHGVLMVQLESKLNVAYLNRIKDTFNAAAITITHTSYPGKGQIQKMGDIRSTLSQEFAAQPFRSIGTAGTVVNFRPIKLGSEQTIRIQKGISNPRQLEATIAHELGHMYFDRLFPGLVHDKTLTAQGYVAGKALSEGMALFVERLYLCSTAGATAGSEEFSNFHPTDTPEAPYADYALYFFNECTSIDQPQHYEKLTEGAAVQINAEYLNLRSQFAALEGIRASVDEKMRDKVPGDQGAVFFNLQNSTPSSYPVGAVLRFPRVFAYYNADACIPLTGEQAKRMEESYTKELKALETKVLDICHAVVSGAPNLNTGFRVASLLTKGDAPKFSVTPVKGGMRVHNSYALFVGCRADTPREGHPETFDSLVPDIHRAVHTAVGFEIGPHPDANLCTAVGNAPALAGNPLAKGYIADAIRQSDLVHLLATVYFSRLEPTFGCLHLDQRAQDVEIAYLTTHFPTLGADGAKAIVEGKQRERRAVVDQSADIAPTALWPQIKENGRVLFFNPLLAPTR